MIIILAFNIYYSGWWINQAHKGGFFKAGQMTTPFFFNVVLRPEPNADYFKLLDTREYFKGTPKVLNPVFQNDFEQDSSACSNTSPAGGKAACLNAEIQSYGPIQLPISADCSQWLRLEADFTVQTREWDVWKYAQWIVQFHKGDQVIKDQSHPRAKTYTCRPNSHTYFL